MQPIVCVFIALNALKSAYDFTFHRKEDAIRSFFRHQLTEIIFYGLVNNTPHGWYPSFLEASYVCMYYYYYFLLLLLLFIIIISHHYYYNNK